MSLVGRSMGAAGTEGVGVGDVLAGTPCRCTGYGPILAVGNAVPPTPRDDKSLARASCAPPRGHGRDWFAPRTSDELADLLLEHPDARIVAGATDVGLWVTKQHRELGTVIFVGDIAEAREAVIEDTGLRIGSAARYADARAPWLGCIRRSLSWSGVSGHSGSQRWNDRREHRERLPDRRHAACAHRAWSQR